MGQPVDPTRVQIEELRRAAELPPPEVVPLHQGQFAVTLPPHGLAIVEFH
jgi:xylan 1,4-beta-xylosidase